jgi:hypothetical protein
VGSRSEILPVVAGQDKLFLTAFAHKGRLSPLLARILVHGIIEIVPLLGAALYGFDAAS